MIIVQSGFSALHRTKGKITVFGGISASLGASHCFVAFIFEIRSTKPASCTYKLGQSVIWTLIEWVEREKGASPTTRSETTPKLESSFLSIGMVVNLHKQQCYTI
jgi:hypothetical protein